MEIQNFETLIKLLGTSVNIYAQRYEQHINEIERAHPVEGEKKTKIRDAIKSDLMEILNSDFSNTSNCFKTKIRIFFENNYTSISNDLSCYLIFRDALLSHVSIKYQYSSLNMPFGYKDNDKYILKVKSFVKKYNANKLENTITPSLSPYLQLKFFSLKVKDNMTMDNIKNAPSTERKKNKLKNELILELIKIVLCDCSAYAKQIKNSMRITDDNIDMFNSTMKEYTDMKNKNKKNYIFSP